MQQIIKQQCTHLYKKIILKIPKRVKQNISFSWKAITGVIENNEISTCSFLENFQKQKQYYFFTKNI